jgi:choline dehydrogenase
MQPDYVVVGAGSAGCQSRRAVGNGASVILLEPGRPTGIPDPIPAAMRKLRNPLVNWNYTTEPSRLRRGAFDWPRGRTLGDTSSINGMLYARCNVDFDSWSRWAPRLDLRRHCAVLRKAETYAQKGDPRCAADGPLKVEDTAPSCR